MSQAVMSIRKEKVKASMWLLMSAVDVGGEAIRAIEPIDRDNPKTRSDRPSIRGRARLS